MQGRLQLSQRLFLLVSVRLPLRPQGLQGLGGIFGSHLDQVMRLAIARNNHLGFLTAAT